MATATQTSDRTSVEPAAAQEQFSRISGELTKALIYELLVILAGAYGVFMMIGVIYAVLTEDNFRGATLYFAYLSNGTVTLLLAASVALTIAIATRTWRMLNAANNEDASTLKRLSSPGWAIIALLASFIAPGVWLRRVNGLIKSLDNNVR